MVSTRRNRILLIALLPIMAAVLYLEGQQYDPALIQFSPSEYGSGGEASFFPPEVAGYRRSGQLRRYTRENLYEYVNGHAEYFISAGFAGLTVGEYVREGGNPDQPEAVVDIYDMEKGIQAFGILSDEGGEDAENMEAGNMGFKTDQVVGFIKGRYYVKINRFDEQAPLEQLAREIDSNMGETPDAAPLFPHLPDLGDVVATRFIKEAYRGLDFANNVIEREYRLNGKRLQVAVFAWDATDTSKQIAAFRDFFDRSAIPHSPIEKEGRTLYEVRDPYEGDWYLIPLSDTLLGVFGEVDEPLLEKLIKGENGAAGQGKP
jgi:hypothetical protein